MYDYGNWLLVLINVGIFFYFLKSSFKPRTKTDWRTFNSFGAFIIALFAEMYGFPLTIYLLTSLFGTRIGIDFTHNNGHLLNSLLGIKGDPHFSSLHIISYGLIIGGFSLLGNAWEILYKAQKRQLLAISGIYAYIRHPQYVAFILIIFGFLVQWPTLITLIMAPILIWRYIHLAKLEEREMSKQFSISYTRYQKHTGAFIPLLKQVLQRFALKPSLTKESL
ncbi:isoprenylcysteine carboxyl methyltransferase [Microgenomates group bacterium RIFCSPLOWO2_01_FULL_47_10]|nr:MAG: isoprenylcysteine carboxyl methyltransferase [Microgenomates group bacterium RIFCSPLOWO2_01_FULL_47_10]